MPTLPEAIIVNGRRYEFRGFCQQCMAEGEHRYDYFECSGAGMCVTADFAKQHAEHR